MHLVAPEKIIARHGDPKWIKSFLVFEHGLCNKKRHE